MKNKNDILVLFKSDDQKITVDVRFDEDTVWLTQNQIADVYDTTRPNITMHIQNILKDGELNKISVSKNFLLTAADGKNAC